MLGEGREVAGNLAGTEALKNWSRNYGNLNNLPEEVCIRFCQWHVENKGFTSAVMSCSERNNSSPGFDTCEMAMPRSSTHVLFGASQWKNDREKWEQIQCRALLVRRHKEYLREICMFRGEGFGAPSEMHGDKVKSKIWNTGHSDYIWGMFFVWGSGFCFCFFTIGAVKAWKGGCWYFLDIFKIQLDKAMNQFWCLCLQQRWTPKVSPNLNYSVFLWFCSVYLNNSLYFQRDVTVSEMDAAVDYMLQGATLMEKLQPF